MVNQVSNVQYRRFPIRKLHDVGTECRLKVGDTAGWKLRYGIVITSIHT